MEKIDSFYTQFKNEMERSLREKDIQINALQASNQELKDQLKIKEKVIYEQARVSNIQKNKRQINIVSKSGKFKMIWKTLLLELEDSKC